MVVLLDIKKINNFKIKLFMLMCEIFLMGRERERERIMKIKINIIEWLYKLNYMICIYIQLTNFSTK